MVDVQVGDHDRVQLVREAVRDRSRASAQVHQGTRQHRVREDPGTVLDEHGRVPEPLDLDRHVCSIPIAAVDATPRRG